MTILYSLISAIIGGWMIFVNIWIFLTYRSFIKELRQFPDRYREYEDKHDKWWHYHFTLLDIPGTPYLFVPMKFEEESLKLAVKKHDTALLTGIKSLLPIFVLVLIYQWIESLT